jgi:murein DD-endopeptidase MepM/ murein hydrolase activator NlpD
MLAVSLAVTFPAPPTYVVSPAPSPEHVRWSSPRRSDALLRGTSLSEILASRGFDSDQIREITEQLRPYRSPRSLRPGVLLRFSGPKRGLPDRIRLALTPDSLLDFVRSDSAWTTRVSLVPFVTDTVRVSGLIRTSLWSARLGGDVNRLGNGEFEGLVYDLADVFAWKVDFTRDLRPGDAVRFALERKVRPDGTVRSRHFLAIELVNGDRVLRAIPQTLPNGSFVYYDENGRSLHGAFLRYPVPYRITSRFSARRYHPILKRYRKHEGIDYGAPAGAPVQATAAGIVTRAGWAGGYGRLVEVRHPRGIRTRYAHLRSIAPDVRPGARIEQGQIIGRVGSSGLATGPHLHYEFVQNGHHRDPLTVDIPSAPSLPASELAAFEEARDDALALLGDLPLPDTTRLARAEPYHAPPRAARSRSHRSTSHARAGSTFPPDTTATTNAPRESSILPARSAATAAAPDPST